MGRQNWAKIIDGYIHLDIRFFQFDSTHPLQLEEFDLPSRKALWAFGSAVEVAVSAVLLCPWLMLIACCLFVRPGFGSLVHRGD